ncbi:unnamed protein product [Closterium sp. NIES-53]
MASLRVLQFDSEGRPVAFDTWHDDLQLYLLSDSKDSVSLFDHMSGAAPAPPATADVLTRSQWLSRDATARLAIRNHLPATECAHFGEHRTAQALYDAVVARYSSPATAAIGRLLLPYLFPELSAFATVADLITHLRTSDAHDRAAVPAKFLPMNQPPMFITLYFIVTRLSDSLRSVRDHFLTLDPTSLTVALLEQHLLTAETSAVAVGAARDTPRSPLFEGCSPSPLSSSFASAAAAANVSVPEDVVEEAAVVVEVAVGAVVGAAVEEVEAVEVVAAVGPVAAVEALVAAVEAVEGVAAVEAAGPMVVGLDLSVEALVVVGASSSSVRARPRRPSSSVSGLFSVGRVRGDCYRCMPPDPCIAATALGASVSCTPPGTAPAEALHSFTLDSGASRCFFRDSTTLTPLPAPVLFRLADPSGGPVVASSSTVLPCSAVPSDSLSSLHLPSFTTNLVSTAAVQDAMVTTNTPGGQRVSICTCTRKGHHLATLTRRSGLSLYTLATSPPQVAASAQVSASGQVAASCSCRLLSHQTLLWHHRVGHPSMPRLRGMHSRLLVSGLPRSLPPLPPSPAPPCLPCVWGRQRAAPYSSSFPPTTAPLQTLHMDVWGPARVSGQGRERYFLLVVYDYTRYATIFPLRSKGEVSAVLIPWIRTVCLQLRERFGQDFPVLRLHSDRGGEFSSDLLRNFCRGEGITQSFTLPDYPQQNGIAERRIGLVMEVARTSMIHAATPHFLWPFAVRYAAHQLNLWPRVSLPETSPTLRWTGTVGDASMFRVWGSRAFVRDTSADKLSARAIPCVFLGFVPDAPGWQFYHPTSRRVLPSQDVMFDESVPFYRLFPYRSAPPPPPPLFLAPGPPPVDPLPPQGPAPSGVSQVDPLPGTAPVQVAVVLGAARGAASGGAASGDAEPGGVGSEAARSGGAEPEGVEPGGAESEGAESRGAKPGGAASSGGPTGASPRLSSQQLREWLLQREHCRSGAPGAGEPGDPGAGGVAVTTGAGDPTEPAAAGAKGTGAGVAGVGGPGVGGAGAAGAGAVDPGAGGAGGTVQSCPYFVPLLQQVLGVPSSTILPPPFLCPPPDQSQPPLQPASPLPVPSPYTEQYGGLTERRKPASRPVSPVRTARRAPCSRPPPVPGTHTMALRPSSVPLRVPLPALPESSLPEVPDPESDRARAASPTVARLLAAAVTDPSFESTAASALVAELLDFAAAYCLDYASALVVESVPASPPSVGGECSLGTDVLEDWQEDFECLAAAVPQAITGPYSSQWQAAMDAEMASWKSTCTYVNEVPPPGVNIVDGMWIFRVKRPPGSLPAFKARYVARGFSQRQGVDYFQSFSPTPKMTSLRVLLHVAARRDYELHSLEFSTTILQGSLHKEIWLRRPPGFTGTTLAALGFAPSTADPSLFLRTDTSLLPFYVLVYVLQRFGFQISSPQLTPLSTSHSLSAPPSDESAEPSGPYPELLGCLITLGMGLVLGGRGLVVLTGHADASLVDDSAKQQSSQGYTFSLGSSSVSWRSTCSSSVLISSCEAEIYAGAMAVQELRWLTYLLIDLGEQPRLPPVLYVDNKAMIALCQEHRLEHRTKHIALRYFLARELQQRCQLRLAYVATRANTADVFTKALLRGDHQRFVTVLGLLNLLCFFS